MRSKGLFLLPVLLFCRGILGASLGAAAFDFSHLSWGRILKEYVRDGRVDYARLKKEPGILDECLKTLAGVPAPRYKSWGLNDRIAFWINAYNALTVKVVVEHYPIRSSWTASLLYPKNSIRQIPGAWTRLKFSVMGQERSLRGIEDVLRKFGDPRIHMAIVCASKGCPPLRGEAYAGSKLDSQLDDQAKIFLQTPSKFRIDRRSGKVYLSPIFKWFGADFIRADEPAQGFGDHSPAERAALNFISRYLDESDRDYLAAGKFEIEYLGYDWSLNERSPR